MSVSEADDWARAEAMSSEQEISRVRCLLDSVTTGLDHPTAEDRAPRDPSIARRTGL